MASTNLLKIHNQLHIDRYYFFDLSDEERSIILQWSLAFRTGVFKKNDKGQLILYDKQFIMMPKKCRVRFQYHRKQAECKINRVWDDLFQMKFCDWKIDGHAIFNSIKPHEIDRLEQVLSYYGNEFDKNRIIAGCQMAKIMKCRDVPGFAAVFEFTERKLKGKNDNSAFQTFINNPAKQNEIKDSLNKLIEETRDLYVPSDKKLSFVNDLAAANHFDKHPIEQNGKILTPKEYIDLARRLASGKAQTIQLTQEESAFKCIFETNEAVAVRIDDVLDGTSVIATLYAKKLKRYPKDKGAKNKAPQKRRKEKKNKNLDAIGHGVSEMAIGD